MRRSVREDPRGGARGARRSGHGPFHVEPPRYRNADAQNPLEKPRHGEWKEGDDQVEAHEKSGDREAPSDQSEEDPLKFLFSPLIADGLRAEQDSGERRA